MSEPYQSDVTATRAVPYRKSSELRTYGSRASRSESRGYGGGKYSPTKEDFFSPKEFVLEPLETTMIEIDVDNKDRGVISPRSASAIKVQGVQTYLPISVTLEDDVSGEFEVTEVQTKSPRRRWKY